MVESLSSSSTAQLSSKEIDYSRALLQTETKEVGKQKVQIHRLSIPRGETFKVVLSDGTEVFLNSDSRWLTLRFLKEKKESSLWKVKLILKLLKMQNILLL